MKSKKVFVNLHQFTNPDGETFYFCGYREGKKYKEQKERYQSEQEARNALNK